MKSFGSKQNFVRQTMAALLAALMIFSALPTWPNASRATASSSRETEILKAFEELQGHITRLPSATFSAAARNSLNAKLKDAKIAFSANDTCAGAKFLEALVAESRNLRSGARTASAEDLSNRASSLRHDLLSTRRDGKPCENAPRVNQMPEVQIVESDNKRLRGAVKFGEPKMWTVQAGGEQFTEMEIPGVQQGVGEPGIPSVPVLYRLVAVPQGAKARVAVKTGNSQSMQVNLYPIQPEAQDSVQKNDELKIPADRFQEPEFTKNKDIYATDSAFPKEVCVVTPLGKARDLQLVQLAIAAGQYNPKSQQLTLFESVEFEVVFEGGKGAFVTTDALNQFESATSTLMNSVINYKAIFEHVIVVNRKFICGGEEFLILTHPDFRDAAVRLAEWKRDKGITTTVINVNDGNGIGPDTKEEIDEFIEGRFNWCGVRPSYVLLLGDAEFIEPFYVNTSGSSTTGTDYPYALLSGDGDDVPDFALGRIPVDTLDQANTVVDKIINYESNPPSQNSFYKNVGIASQFQCCRSGGQQGRDLRSFIETSELVRNELLNQNYNVDRIYTKTVEGSGGSTPRRFYNGTLLPEELDADSGFAWDGDTDDIVNAWNAGRFLFLHRDHGWEDGWAHPDFTTTNVNNDLNNGELLPVVFSVNCASGLFDNETANGDYGTTANREYFAERLLRRENGGAVGMLGDTRNSPTWANSALTRGFFDAVWPNTVGDFGDNTRHRRLGDILNHGKLYLITQVGVAGTTEAPTQWNVTSELYMWHVLGDPTLEMWTRRPLRVMPWDFAAQWANLFTLKVKYGFERATITAFQQTKSGFVHIGRATVKNGEATLQVVQRPVNGIPIQLIASADGEVSVNLTKKNDK
ncbi:MAG: C25 family cysteine peptidase [Acidobacteriota bacterium]|nr:C25 family cysteine peptidase [Acidobacteriota bacterium]